METYLHSPYDRDAAQQEQYPPCLPRHCDVVLTTLIHSVLKEQKQRTEEEIESYCGSSVTTDTIDTCDTRKSILSSDNDDDKDESIYVSIEDQSFMKSLSSLSLSSLSYSLCGEYVILAHPSPFTGDSISHTSDISNSSWEYIDEDDNDELG